MKEFTTTSLKNISQDVSFLKEFLKLSYDSLQEAKTIFKASFINRDIEKYRQIAHKIKTTLVLLGLTNFHSTISSGKELLQTADDASLNTFQLTVLSNLDTTLNLIDQEISNLKS